MESLNCTVTLEALAIDDGNANKLSVVEVSSTSKMLENGAGDLSSASSHSTRCHRSVPQKSFLRQYVQKTHTFMMGRPVIPNGAPGVLLRRVTNSTFTLAFVEVFIALRIKPDERRPTLLFYGYFGLNLPVDGKENRTQPVNVP
eukprot:IDg1531t1